MLPCFIKHHLMCPSTTYVSINLLQVSQRWKVYEVIVNIPLGVRLVPQLFHM